MAAEAGAELSGMEFSNAYGLAPAFASVTKSAFYRWATFYYEDGRVIEGAGSARGRSVIDEDAHERSRCIAILDRASEAMRAQLRAVTAETSFLAAELGRSDVGIDPLTQRFPVTLRLEGTVRGTGGIRIADEDCSTSVAGLYAAGDASTRELICGGFTGGGSHNAAWAISSGNWAGRGAATFALGLGAHGATRNAQALGQAALRPTAARTARSTTALVRDVQAEVFPVRAQPVPHAAGLNRARCERLHSLWRDTLASADRSPSTRETLRGR